MSPHVLDLWYSGQMSLIITAKKPHSTARFVLVIAVVRKATAGQQAASQGCDRWVVVAVYASVGRAAHGMHALGRAARGMHVQRFGKQRPGLKLPQSQYVTVLSPS